MDRLLRSMEQIQQTSYTDEYEIVVVDWGSHYPISRLLKPALYPTECHRFVYIPPEVAARFDTPFCETVALNTGIRRARGRWVARLDQDILVGERFIEWFQRYYPGERTGNDFGNAFFSLRRDLPEGVHSPTLDAPIWKNVSADAPCYFIGAVGILLAPRELWHRTRGYDEHLIHRNGMEIDLCARFEKLAGLVNLGKMLDCPFYHQWHDRGDADSRISNNQSMVAALMNGAERHLNDEHWGLGDLQLAETII